MSPAVFFKMYSPNAIATQIKYGIPASVVLAQAALESAWGESGLTKSANNFFGIKDAKKDEWYGAYVVRDTTEYIGGVKQTVSAPFRKYSTPQGSFDDHAAFLIANKRYRSLFALQPTDFTGWSLGLQKAGYATDPSYANKLIGLVNRYKLAQYDNEAVLKKKSL